MTLSIKALERITDRAVRRILRDAMRDITTIDEFDYAVSRIDRIGYSKVYDAIAKVYLEGYNAAGGLIRKHFVVAAVDPLGDVQNIIDPLITYHTTQMLSGISGMASAQRLDVVDTLAMCYEKGYTATQIAKKMGGFFDDDPTAARRFARTATNDIYNKAHLARYTDSGVVDGVKFSAHIDNRTSPVCRMLDGTVWKVDSDEIKSPPRHFHCRSRILPYFGGIPGERDYTKDFSQEFIDEAGQMQDTFISKYWNF